MHLYKISAFFLDLKRKRLKKEINIVREELRGTYNFSKKINIRGRLEALESDVSLINSALSTINRLIRRQPW